MSVFNALYTARLILVLELIVQTIVITTEAISNARYKKFPATATMVGYTGQSLLVIIVAIIQISVTALVARNLRYVLYNSPWKVSGACIIFSVASISFRTLTSWFIQDPGSAYYIVTYNITSISILVGLALWMPFVFCKSDKYYTPPSSTTSGANVNARSRIVTTNGSGRAPLYRPNNEERDDELPSYYEMIPPPAYKTKSNTTANASGDDSTSQNEADAADTNNVGSSSQINELAVATPQSNEGAATSSQTNEEATTATPLINEPAASTATNTHTPNTAV
ncbi:hypothetical protein V8B55DRAFT_1458592 [Mucor lusitanicus]|uniref:Uncharacterized protein n=2 Tax=Mucor circinelloides f. lusitanicus TaxID=29924 RepID=A0A168KDY0_MUCCL|nr:hypothetical protein MUCCIDRAFT_156494 [Mucor lusitanicus CBS 277.49]